MSQSNLCFKNAMFLFHYANVLDQISGKNQYSNFCRVISEYHFSLNTKDEEPSFYFSDDDITDANEKESAYFSLIWQILKHKYIPYLDETIKDLKILEQFHQEEHNNQPEHKELLSLMETLRSSDKVMWAASKLCHIKTGTTAHQMEYNAFNVDLNSFISQIKTSSFFLNVPVSIHIKSLKEDNKEKNIQRLIKVAEEFPSLFKYDINLIEIFYNKSIKKINTAIKTHFYKYVFNDYEPYHSFEVKKENELFRDLKKLFNTPNYDLDNLPDPFYESVKFKNCVSGSVIVYEEMTEHSPIAILSCDIKTIIDLF